MPEGVLAGRFQLESRAGAGGMGTIYRAVDRQTGRRVAVKLVRQRIPEDGDRFLREGAILSTLHHPHIVEYVAHGRTSDGTLFVAMDWVDGVTLQDRLVSQGLSVAETVLMAERVAGGLAEVHQHGLVHRDVKPTNIIFPGGDVARATMIDFGLARPAVSGHGANLTETGAVVGTPNYMAPEQVRGDKQLDASVDVFGLGCVLYECLTGRLAFEGRRFLALKAKILLWHPVRPSALAADIPEELDDLVLLMLAKEPLARPRDGAEVVARLRALDGLAGGGAGRTRRRIEPPTIVDSDTGQVAVVVATTLEATDVTAAPTMSSDDVGALRRSLEGTLADYDAELDVLHDGSVVATLEGAKDLLDLARRAVGCALAIRDARPEMIVGVGAAEGRDRILDEVVQGLARDAMSMLFSASTNVPADAIWIDKGTAAVLEREYEVVRVKQTSYLRRPRA